jgi:hypothetical protein
VMSMGGMGYAAEYHVERYMRECFVPRIAPVSRVSDDSRTISCLCWNPSANFSRETGNDHELRGREGPQTASKLLGALHLQWVVPILCIGGSILWSLDI